ncbi:MAG: hypothetical protein NXI30_14450 [bacterium]|nr:hypothetical protein [bacterium]
MASAIPGRVDRDTRGGEAFRRTAHDARARVSTRAQAGGQVAQAVAPPDIDVFRLVVAAAGLSVGVVLPAALILWAASDVLAGLGARVLALLA